MREMARESQIRSIIGGGYVPAAPVLSGTYITPETGLTVAPVYAAVNVISTDLATLPRHVYRKLPGGGREIEREMELGVINDIVGAEPNDEMDGFRWLQTLMGHVLTRGNAYCEIVRKDGWPVSLELLHPGRTVPRRVDDVGALYYLLDNERKLSPENVLHFAGMGFDGIVGYSPITICRQTVGLTIAAEQYGAAYFGNGARMNGFLKTAKALKAGAISNLRNTFNQIHQGTQNAHQIGILEEGMDWVQNSFSPDDGQFLQTRQFQVIDIARIFRIPPHKIGDYSQSHLANVEEANLDYQAMTLMGWVTMLERQLTIKLLTREQRRTHEIGFDMTALMRGNSAARMARAQTLRNTGAWSANEIRLAEGFNPLPDGSGGDLHLVQGQYVPLDQVGKLPPTPPPTTRSVDRDDP